MVIVRHTKETDSKELSEDEKLIEDVLRFEIPYWMYVVQQYITEGAKEKQSEDPFAAVL